MDRGLAREAEVSARTSGAVWRHCLPATVSGTDLCGLRPCCWSLGFPSFAVGSLQLLGTCEERP